MDFFHALLADCGDACVPRRRASRLRGVPGRVGFDDFAGEQQLGGVAGQEGGHRQPPARRLARVEGQFALLFDLAQTLCFCYNKAISTRLPER